MKLKGSPDVKISKSEIEREKSRNGICNQYPVFCFKHLTTNKQYNLDRINPDDATVILKKLSELSLISWIDLHLRSKKSGIETLTYGQLNFDVSEDHAIEQPVSKDTKVLSIRFNQQAYRILGIKRDSCSICHIIGFDFDFSAYKH